MAKMQNQPRSQSQSMDRRESHENSESSPMHGGQCATGFLQGHRDVNVGDVERVVSVMGGGVLTLFGAARGGLMGLGLTVLGGSLLYRGLTGHCEAYHAMGVDTTDRDHGSELEGGQEGHGRSRGDARARASAAGAAL